MRQVEYASSEDFDLSRGYKEYEAKVKNLKGIFEKIKDMVDISIYQEEFNSIQDEVINDPSITKQMPSNEMQLEYEGMVLSPYIKRLDNLTKKIEEDVLPFYELYLLTTKIDMQLDRITEDTINEVIEKAIKLVQAINTLNTHNSDDKNGIIAKAYEAVYRVILNEEMFDRTDVLDYVKNLNIKTNIENLGRLLSKDLDKVDRESLIDDEISSLETEKLGNDYLSHEVIRNLSIRTVGDHSSEYQARKRKAIEEVKDEVSSLAKEKETLKTTLSDNTTTIKKLKIYKSGLIAKAASLVLVPIITFQVGNELGKMASNKVTEYQTITRTVDYQTGKIIGDVEKIFEEEKTAYAATVLSCTPWKKNPAGIGYIRNVTAYEYVAPDDTEEEHRINDEDLKNNVREKYTYVETKDDLEEDDNTKDTSILIIETYQDGETRKSTKFIIPGMVMGIVLGMIIDTILLLLRVYDLEKIKIKIEELNEEIKEKNLSNEQIKDRLKKMLEDAEKVKEKYNDVVKKYGTWQDSMIFDGIDTSWIIEEKKKKVIQKKK